MPYKNQTYQPTEVGRTPEEREVILVALYEHMMQGHSLRFFPMHSHQTLARLKNDYPDFKQRTEAIIREANMTLEAKLITKMNNDETPMNLRAFELLTRHRSGFKPEPEKVKDTAQAIHVVMVNDRETADAIREEKSDD